MISLSGPLPLGRPVCHDTTVMTYAAYLRVYEPVSAFPEPDRSRWAAYAASPARPRRRDSTAAEHAEALRRAVAVPQIVVPDRESEHAYVRRADGVTYVCPWQTRLRCLLAYGRMRSAPGSPLAGTLPACDEDQATAALARLEAERRRGAAARLHILASVWTVPLAWFVPFAATERWLALGLGEERAAAARTTSAARALVYTTPMSRARRRVARGLAALRGVPSGYADAAWEPLRAEAELAQVGRWLEEFHPYSLVELDYGGLVHVLNDDALRGDQSVAEIRAAIDGVARGECELAVAMYKRAHGRWRAFAEFEMAN
jgi:hypothetical protein